MPTPDKPITTPQTSPEQPVREISQTDHLNKKLLTSLFNRLEEQGEMILGEVAETTDKPTSDDKEWEA